MKIRLKKIKPRDPVARVLRDPSGPFTKKVEAPKTQYKRKPKHPKGDPDGLS